MPAPAKTVVILGASPKPDRASHMLLQRLIRSAGHDPVPVRPALKEIAGVAVHGSLDEIPREPDLLAMYVNAERSSALAKDILRLRPRRVIFNPGAENPRLEAELNRAGIPTENACALVLLAQGAL